MAGAQGIRAGKAYVELGVHDKLTRGLRRAQKRLKAFGDGVRAAGMQMVRASAAAIVPFAASGVVFAGFEQRMARVKALTNASSRDFIRLSDEAKRLGETTVYSAAQAADAMSYFALAGYDTEQILKAIGPTLDMAAAGQLDVAEAADNGVTPGLTDPDDVPEPPDEPVTQSGDRWILGDHRLLCGDSSKAEDVDRLLDGAPVHLVNTDPPYNVAVEPRSNNAIAAGNSSFPVAKPKSRHHQAFDLARHPEKAKPTTKKLRPKDRPLANDFVSDEEFDRLLLAWFGNIARVLMPGRACYIWGGYANCANYPPALKASGLKFSQALIWHKQHPVLGRKDFMSDHEWCFYCWREGVAHVFLGPNNVSDVWSVKKVNPQSMVHLTEKPVELAVRAIQYSSRPGENVLDLFGGSGSTLIAAEQTGRKAFLMGLDQAYCDVIVERWEKFTGRKAERAKK